MPSARRARRRSGRGRRRPSRRRPRVGGAIIDRRAGELLQPVVGRARRARRRRIRSREQLDERQEQRAVEAVLDRDRPARRWRSRPPRRRGRTGRVNSRPRIIASAMSRTANSSKQSSQASAASAAASGAIGSSPDDLAALALLPPAVDARVNVGHEGVKMHATFLRDRRGVEEQVHQQRLAAPDLAVDVEAARRLGRLGADQPTKRAGPPPGR